MKDRHCIILHVKTEEEEKKFMDEFLKHGWYEESRFGGWFTFDYNKGREWLTLIKMCKDIE